MREEETKPKPKFKVGDRVITNKGYIGKFEGWVSDYQVRVLFEESGCNVVIHPKDLKLVEEETLIKLTGEAIKNNEMVVSIDEWILPEGYIFKDENGNVINATKIVLEKKKKEYPKTYVECSDILSVYTDPDIDGYKGELLWAFQKLLICRDAYWKIAGEEMGLGKPWKPDWDDGCYVIFTNGDGLIRRDIQFGINTILAFPTEEMRDAFYENFKEEIEMCKELL